MRMKKLSFLAIFAVVLFLPSSILSKSHYEYIYSPESDIYFGHISFTEVKYDGKDPVVIREGERTPEIAVLNLPLTSGDIIRTTASRRCEIQFDTGTIIRLDLDTELKIETILAQSLSSRKKITNLVLNKGQIYIMYKKYNSREVFQIITSNAAVKMKHKTVATIKAREDRITDVQVKHGKAYVLYGPDADHLREEKVKKLQKLTVSRDRKVFYDEYRPDVDFELWNEVINENFQELHKGKSFLPKPIQKFPKAVFYFAQKYSNLYGEWMWTKLYGYVWRPNYNDYYPWGSWQPYNYGKWREVNGQLFWVPEETWGWVPYHLGLWLWHKDNGWVWLPGSAFAPAWVAWDFFMGYYTWRPWSLFDWYNPSGYYYAQGYYYWESYAGPEDKAQKTPPIRRVIRKDQLKKKKSSQYPRPKELKRVYNNYVSALKKNDKRVLDTLQKIPEQTIIVKGKDLNVSRIQEKSIRFKQLSEQLESSPQQKQVFPQKFPQDPDLKAAWTFRRNREVTELRKYVISSFIREKEEVSGARKDLPLSGTKIAVSPKTEVDAKKIPFSKEKAALSKKGNIVSLPKAKPFKLHSSMGISEWTPMRLRDWNPDVRTAQRMGVKITYSSRANEIRCPALNLSSKNVVVSRSRLSSRGGFHSSGSSSSSGSGSSSGSSGGSSSAGSSSKDSSSGSSSSSGGSKGGAVKK